MDTGPGGRRVVEIHSSGGLGGRRLEHSGQAPGAGLTGPGTGRERAGRGLGASLAWAGEANVATNDWAKNK